MKRRFIPFVWAFMLLLILLPSLQAAAAEGDTVTETGSEALLNVFNGTILDFDESRIIWKEAGDKMLWLYNRTDGSQVKIFDAAGSDDFIRNAKLSAEGIVYNSSLYVNYYWKDGEVRQLVAGQDLNAVEGNFAVFGSIVVDLTTGQSRSLPNSYFVNTNRFDLSADGSVVYVDRTYRSNLYKSLPDGTLTTLVPPASSGYLSYGGPLTDGKNVLYKVLKWTSSGYKWAVRLRDADDKITYLAQNPFYSFFTNPKTNYQLNNGWITYQEYNKEKDNWILYVRSPEGEAKPIFETPLQSWKQSWYSRVGLSINQLGADGSVVYTVYKRSITNTQTYLYSTQANQHVRLSSDPGEFHYRNGAWYRLTWNSLFAISL